MKYFKHNIKFVLFTTIILLTAPIFSYADLSSTLKLLAEVRGLEQSSPDLIASNSRLRETIDLIYQKIIESLIVELDLLKHPATTSVEFGRIASSLKKGEIKTFTFTRIPKNSSSLINFDIETGGLSVGSLSNQVIGNYFNWQVANNFLAGRQYKIRAEDQEGKILGVSDPFTVSNDIALAPTIVTPILMQPTTTPIESTIQQSILGVGPAPDINFGLINYWSFGYNSYSCRTVGGAVTNADGKIGTGLGLDGVNSYCIVTTSRQYYPSKFSINLWAKSDSLHTDAWARSGWFVSLKDGAGYQIGPIDGTKKVKFTILDNTSANSVAYDVGTVEPIDISNWHNYTITYDGLVADVYLDGELATSTSLSLDRGYIGKEDLIFGSDYSSEYRQFGSGTLDEIRLYDRSITPCEVKILAGKICQGASVDSGGQQVAAIYSVFGRFLDGFEK
ncbi:MAG: LamG domain-containing protein [Candidatus Vogelbacteria bacterium]|nr:LamG domain-containing protein [Candidatus Vogelbacteria bacterium]